MMGRSKVNAAGRSFVGLCVLIFMILIGLVIGGIMLVRLNDSTTEAKQQTEINRTVLKAIKANQDYLVRCGTGD